ncbi:uncharacterized protein LOC128683611 [Plodia interpunctella]|uniref:uncharacterized protein LOC128683611 n=1 Tax=Plodia interpunctella TaxID=58824 RepID=UPI002367C42E|nr:uncharacterized protein LOC128683611 [Plodia interpunctella]
MKMPRKKYKKRNQKQKQLKIIQARLMAISLKMDNYIYKSRPISTCDARAYYHEVTSYRSDSEENARILQVIDKLKCQLKGIIEEGQDSTSYYNVQEIIENSMATCPLSPTYSMQNEDRDTPSNMQVEKDNGIAVDGVAKSIDTVDLCSDEDIDETILTRTEKQNEASNSNIKDIERSLSNLTVDTDNSIHTQNVAENEITTACLNTTRCPRSDNINKTVMELNPKKQRADSIPCIGKKDQNILIVSDVDTTNNNTNSISTTNKLEVKTSEKIVPKKKKCTNKTKKKDSHNNTNVKPKKGRAKVATKKGTINKGNVSHDIENVHSQFTVNNKFKKPAQVFVQVKSHPMDTVYNSNVENDLSWMENIRYIREVAPDEIDRTLTYLNDNFWQTNVLTLNDQDFLY